MARHLPTALGILLLGAAAAHAQVPILMYHAHPNLGYNETEFRQHMDHLVEEGYTTITPDEFLRWRLEDEPLPPRPVFLTVDDNYILTYTSMYPILKERNMVITNFVITNSVGAQNGLHYVGWDELREMGASGLVINESHSASHPHLSTLTEGQSWHELAASKQAMESNLVDRTIEHFCYPYGDYDERVIEQAIEAGYAAGYTVIDELNYRDTPVFELRRLWADGRTLESFQEMMSYDDHIPSPPGEGWALDNSSPHFTHEPAAWNLHEGAPGAHAGSHLQRGPGTGTVRARWAVALPEPGWYRVHAWWPSPTMDRASDAPYEIHHTGGSTTVRVDQRGSGGQWNALGVFRFEDTATVFLSNDTDGTVTADAIWIESAEAPAQDMMVVY